MKTLIFRISLPDDESSPCWRDVEITADKPLSKLAEGIIDSFGFDFDHAYGFFSSLDYHCYSSPVKYELFADMDDDMSSDLPGISKPLSVKKTKSGDAFIELGQKMQFLFDYGDEWRFLVELKEFGKKTSKTRYPRVIDTKGEAPLQYPDFDDENIQYEDGEPIGINPVTGEILRFVKPTKS